MAISNAANYPESIFIGIKDPGLAFFVSSLRQVLKIFFKKPTAIVIKGELE